MFSNPEGTNVVSIATLYARKAARIALSESQGIAEDDGMTAQRPSVYPYVERDPPGATVHLLREQKGWTLEQLAEHCVKGDGKTLDVGTLSRLERNESYSRPTLSVVARALGVEVRTLLTPPELLSLPQPIKDILHLEGEARLAVLKIAELAIKPYLSSKK